MAKDKIPVTQAIRLLRQKKVEFQHFFYEYVEKGGSKQFADLFEKDEYEVIKTLVMCPDGENPVIVLMHGNKEVSTKKLSEILKAKKVAPCDEKTATNWTGYQFGGTSPFGTKKEMNIYAEKSIFLLEKVYINGGKRGFIIGIEPKYIESILPVTKVNIALDK